MIGFVHTQADNFLATVRKYMQLRGGMTQKDLAELINVGISTMSRFLNQKSKDFDPQLIASIVAGLNIPMHEIVDFVDEESTVSFKKLVEFYKVNIASVAPASKESSDEELSTGLSAGTVYSGKKEDSSVKDKLSRLSPRQKGFLTDFLDLEAEDRDLVVDVASSLLNYFRQKRSSFNVG